METHFYNVNLNWDRGRRGLMCSPELDRQDGICVEVATPPEFPKGIAGIWSPEHLFVASISGCLMTTFLAIAENSSLEFKAYRCEAKGKMEMVEGNLMISEIKLKPTVVITNEVYKNKTMRILKKAEDACLIAHSIKSKIIMEMNIEVKPVLIASE